MIQRLFVLSALTLLATACQREAGQRTPRDDRPRETAGAAPDASPAPLPIAPPPPLPDDDGFLEFERNTIDVFRQAAPATVFVTQKQLVRDRWNLRALEVPAGSGTGFIWDDQGHIVTNFHVVANGRSFSVTLLDGKSHAAILVGGDPKKDIAVLKVADEAKSALALIRLPAREKPLVVGQRAIAIGNPFGLDHTLTSGIISALGREVRGYGGVSIRDMIQTDASINPGNSGGPLLNSKGELIGMNTMIYSQSGQSAGIGFAVPVATIRRIVPQIIKHGQAERATLGVELVSDDIVARHRIRGAVIATVLPNSPAAQAGLKGLTQSRSGIMLGDVIVKIGDTSIENYDDLFNALDLHTPGEQIAVTVRRGEEDVTVTLTLSSNL